MSEELSELEAARAAFASQKGTPVVEEPVIEKVENTEVVNEEPKAEAVKAEPVAEKVEEPTITKTLNELLAEKSGGKFQTYEDLERELSKPVNEFADDEIKRWNDLKKKGVKLDKEFFELQAEDFSKIENPVTILQKDMELLNPEGKGLSKKTIEIEIVRKYNMNDWAEKDEKGNWIERDDEELTDEARADKEKMYRDAGVKKQGLINYRNERAFFNEPDENALKQQAEQERIAQENWGTTVNDVYTKVTSFSTIIDEKTNEAFEYKLSETDRKDIAEAMKEGNIFKGKEYTDEKGQLQINHQRVFEMLAKEKAYNQAIKNAYNDGKAVGAKTFIKEDLKNVGFKSTDGTPQTTTAPKTEQEAIAQAMRSKGLRL